MPEGTGAPLHGTVISYLGMGCLILGASGTGKSRLAQEAMVVGAKLVADDRVNIALTSGLLVAAPVPELAGIFEIHGIGIIRVNDALARQVLHLVVELDPSADDRLPEPQRMELLGMPLPHLRISPPPKTSAAGLLLYMRSMQLGGVLPTDWRPLKA
jgi:HPr kinase/phosphorylase